MSKTIWGDIPEATLTTEGYWLAQDPKIRALRQMITQVGGERDAAALKLAQQGFLIDVPIHVWNWEPVGTMLVRQHQGFTWVPSGLQAPGGGSGPVPPGAIKVSIDAKDYPPFDPPPPPPTPPQDLIGIRWGEGTWDFSKPNELQVAYAVNHAARFPEGYIYDDPNGTGKYRFHLMGSPLMDPNRRAAVWIKIS